uniref:PRA1 family protein n=1 Tax=Saccoglossus kowalevskii TaxID=10224 RepID=A0ABM0MI89_SACKO|nr:PREDICTED: prenylated Rab acceptor protein 1-like [Saccoglossus kowalevskii]
MNREPQTINNRGSKVNSQRKAETREKTKDVSAFRDDVIVHAHDNMRKHIPNKLALQMETVDVKVDSGVTNNDSADDKASMALNTLSNVNAKDFVQKQRENLKPWQEFLNTSKVSKPRSVAHLTSRVTKNLERFQSNYLLVSIVLFIYCIITSPLLLVACIFLVGGCYLIKARQAAGKVILLVTRTSGQTLDYNDLRNGRELTVGQQYLAITLFSCPLFFLAGAGSAVFWVIGASVFLVMLHASLLQIEVAEEPDTDLTMETV